MTHISEFFINYGTVLVTVLGVQGSDGERETLPVSVYYLIFIFNFYHLLVWKMIV